MAELHDKVIAAKIQAARRKHVETVSFLTDQGNGFFVTILGQRLFEFDTKVEADSFRDDLNAALGPVKDDLRLMYDNKINAELT